MKKANIERHARHIMLKEIGGPGQTRIANSTVAIIGLGGLGAPCALYLAAAGIGRLILIDDDKIEISNLQRQIIYQSKDIGIKKTEAARNALLSLDSDIEISSHDCRIGPENAKSILRDADIIIDGSDNFETRFLVNEAAYSLNKVLVFGALGRFDGQVGAFDFRTQNAKANGPCYQCFVPSMPPNAETCAQMGVVGALCGIIGSIMALEVIKIITEAGNSLLGRIMIYEGLSAKSRTIRLNKDENCQICSKANI